MKKCPKCGESKTSDNFSPAKKTLDGLHCYCKPCHMFLERIRRKKQGCKVKRYRQKRGELLECMQCFQFLPMDNFFPSKRGSYGKLAYCKPCRKSQTYKSESKEERNRRKRIYDKDGRYRARIRLQKFKRQYRRKVMNDGTVTAKFSRDMLAKRKCTYCSKFTKTKERSLDHIIPLSRGGTHSAENIVMACLTCNIRKGILSAEEFLEKLIIENGVTDH